MTTHPNASVRPLVDAGIVDVDSAAAVAITRDRADITVMRCARSGVYFLDRSTHIDDAYYSDHRTPNAVVRVDGPPVRRTPPADTQRRRTQLARLVTGRSWIDFGAGWGHVLSALAPDASEAVGVELSRQRREYMAAMGLRAVARLDELEPGEVFDLVSAFHVVEHLSEPVGILTEIRERLAPGGVLVVEVPHARDALIEVYQSSAFRSFTFWSEHLVLHTRESLTHLLRLAGFSDVRIQGVQRYPLANHLNWLANAEPSGQSVWPELVDGRLDDAYARVLGSIDATDTLVAYARR